MTTTFAPTPREGGAAVEATSLYRFFRAGDAQTLALQGVSISVSAGELVVVSGPSGSGKCLAGIDNPNGGIVRINGQRLSHRPEHVQAQMRAAHIAHLAATMNAMLARLERGRAAQHRLVSDASHELRSPLATITAALEMASGRPELMDNDLIDESLLPEARRMHRLIEDLLLLARSDEDAMDLRREDVDVDDLLLAEASRLRAIGSVHTVTHIEACRTVGDRGALARVVRNLVDNAVRHASSTVTMDCRPVAGHAVITIADDGPGIPVQDRARIFERFVRLDPTRTRSSGGSGLGLSIVEQIMRSHHGTVAVGDAANGGAVFTLTLPLAQQDSAGTDFQAGSLRSR